MLRRGVKRGPMPEVLLLAMGGALVVAVAPVLESVAGVVVKVPLYEMRWVVF